MFLKNDSYTYTSMSSKISDRVNCLYDGKE